MGLNYDYSYAWEKLYSAVRLLATSNGDLRDRLRDSYDGWHTLRDESFPGSEELQKEYADIKELITKGDKDKRVGTVGDATRNMTIEEAHDLAVRIFDLFHKVVEKHHGVSEE